jgi:hypothetical protein
MRDPILVQIWLYALNASSGANALVPRWYGTERFADHREWHGIRQRRQ